MTTKVPPKVRKWAVDWANSHNYEYPGLAYNAVNFGTRQDDQHKEFAEWFFRVAGSDAVEKAASDPNSTVRYTALLSGRVCLARLTYMAIRDKSDRNSMLAGNLASKKVTVRPAITERHA